MGEGIKKSLLAKETSVGEEETRIIDGNEELSLKRRVWIETKKIWVVAGPATFTRVATFGTNVISQAFVGHIGSTQLAAFSLVFTVLVRFANGILVCLFWLPLLFLFAVFELHDKLVRKKLRLKQIKFCLLLKPSVYKQLRL